MANFGDALRGIASVLNPAEERAALQEEQQKRQAMNQAGMMMLQQKIQQQSPEYQMRMDTLKNERAFREAASSAGGDWTKIAGAAMQFGKPEIAMSVFNREQDRISRAQASKDALEQRMAEFETRMADKALDRESRERLSAQAEATKKTIAEMTANIARDNQELKKLTLAMSGQGKAPNGYRWKADEPGVLEPIPGGPAGKLSSDAAGRAAMMDQAAKDLDFVESKIIKKDGSLDRTLVAAISIPGFAGMPGYTDARKVYSAIENAIAAKLRIETGAATNPGEIVNTANRFKPTISDTAESARDKITRLREAMKMGLEQMHVAGYISDETYRKAKAMKGTGQSSEPNIDDLLKKYGGS